MDRPWTTERAVAELYARSVGERPAQKPSGLERTTVSGRRDSNPRPSPWQGHGSGPPGRLRSAELGLFRPALHPVRRVGPSPMADVERVKPLRTQPGRPVTRQPASAVPLDDASGGRRGRLPRDTHLPGGQATVSSLGDTAGGCGGAFRAEALGLLLGVAAVESIRFGGPSEFLAEAARTLAAERAATPDVAGVAG